VGKSTLLNDFAGRFSNAIHLDLETFVDREIFNFDSSAKETLKAISFLKAKEIHGKGTLIILDEIGNCPKAMHWIEKLANGQEDIPAGTKTHDSVEGSTSKTNIPFVVATSSFNTPALERLIDPVKMVLAPRYLFPFSFEEFIIALDDKPSIEALQEVPVPYYAYGKLLNYFHLYTLIGGMPEIVSEYISNRHLYQLKKTYERISNGFTGGLDHLSSSGKGRELATELLQNTYPFAATRISFSHFGNLDKGSREISHAFRILENSYLLQLIYPVVSTVLPLSPDSSRFPRLQMLDTGLVNYFSGIQKPLFQSHDMNSIFSGQIARQVVGQEIRTAETHEQPGKSPVNFWIRHKAQSSAEVDFVIPFDDLLIPVVVRSGEPGRLRSLHQFIDQAPHSFAVRLYAGNLAVQQSQTISGKKFYLLNLPYFLAGKIRDHLKGFIRFTAGK
jgi:predicted AAA+ superfamily ATPase